jgi:hypothetical protein
MNNTVRIVLAVIAGAAIWFALVIASDWTIRTQWLEYAAVFKAMTFTVPMMIARLVESTVALVIAARATAKIAPASHLAPWALALLLLAAFAPYHLLMIWAKFPPWYHAYFLTSLLVLPPLVGSVAAPQRASA